MNERKRIEKVLEAMVGIRDIVKYEGEKRKRTHYSIKSIFGFFEKNKDKSLGTIEWSDYTRFPRTYEGAMMALELFIEDLNEELINE